MRLIPLCSQTSKGAACFGDPVVDVSVDGSVMGEGAAQVSEGLYYLESLRSPVSVACGTGFLELAGTSPWSRSRLSLAEENLSICNCISCWSPALSAVVSSLLHLCDGLQSPEVEHLSDRPVPDVDARLTVSEGI